MMSRPSAIRPSGIYAEFEGSLWQSTSPWPGKPALIRTLAAIRPEGFEATSSPGVFVREVPGRNITRLVQITTLCRYRGGGPFVVIGTGDTSQADLVYQGDDRAWAIALPGFHQGDRYVDGGEILGTADERELEDVRETVEDIPFDPR